MQGCKRYTNETNKKYKKNGKRLIKKWKKEQ